MTSDVFYLDHAATTPVHPEVLEAALPYLQQNFANPSSIYQLGMNVARAIKSTREQIAKVFGTTPDGIVFSSGATESNHLALTGVAFSPRYQGKQIIISSLEHPSVVSSAQFLEEQGFQVDVIEATPQGIVDLDHLQSLLSEETRLVSCIAVNNEIGTQQPLNELVQIVKQYNPQIVIHSDATQAIGKMDLSLSTLGLDILTMSGHKFYAPKGIGALVMRSGLFLNSIMVGGGQEHGLRGGTENVFGIIALGKALERVQKNASTWHIGLEQFRQQWIDLIQSQFPQVVYFDSPYILPHYLNIGIPRVPAEVLLHHLESENICVSTGSACSSRKRKKTQTIWQTIFFKNTYAPSMIRLSFGETNLHQDSELLFQKVTSVFKDLMSLS